MKESLCGIRAGKRAGVEMGERLAGNKHALTFPSLETPRTESRKTNDQHPPRLAVSSA